MLCVGPHVLYVSIPLFHSLFLYLLPCLSSMSSLSPLHHYILSTLTSLSPPLFVSPSLQDRWGEQDCSSFSPRRLLIHQGHSCVWIMSELRSKYLSMTSCLDWCSCAIRFFMYHSLDCLAASLAGEGLPCQYPWNTEKEKSLSGLAQKCNAA